MTCMITPPSLEMLTHVQRLRDAEKAEVRPKADAIAAVYMEEKATEVAKAEGRDEPTEDDHATVRRAIKGAVLSGAYPIPLHDDGGGLLEWVPVSTILAAPERYHGRTGPDPIEPDYDDGRQVAKLYLDGTSPCIHSFARGGQTYMLSRGVEWIEVRSGRDAEVAEVAADALRQHPDVYAYAGRVACVRDGKLVVLDKAGLQYLLGSRFQFYREKSQPNGGTVRVLMNPPRGVVEMMNVPEIVGRLRPADAVISAPTMRPDGSLLTTPGYDEATRLVLDVLADAVMPVPDRPTVEDALAALDRVLLPFRDFPYPGAVDRGVLLAALITAVVRPVLPTAPAFGFDAPTQGSGKTLLARCVGLLAAGADPLVVPHTHGRDDEEVRKRLTAMLTNAAPCVVWDNVVGTWDSPAMAAMLTSGTFTDRVLGRSETVTFLIRTSWLVTGNNLAPAGDLTRRVLVCRIDPGTDRPYARSFDLDPAAYVRDHRQEIVRNVLTILRAYRVAAPAPAPGKMASFEDWDTMVRQPVAWLASLRDDLADPMKAVDARQVLDPEQERLLTLLDAIARVCGVSRVFETRQMADAYLLGRQQADTLLDEDEDESRALRDLAEALDDFNAKGVRLSTRSIGRILANRVDRIADGRCLRRVGAGRVASWKIETVGGEE